MSLQSLPGLGSGSPRSSTIGSDGLLPNIIVLRSLSLAGPSTGRGQVEVLRPQMNLLTRLSLGLGIQIHGSERRGRRANDWRNSSQIVEPYWFWMASNRSKIRLVHKKDGYVSLPYRRFCASSLPSIRGFVSLPHGYRSPILQITKAPPPCIST